jgi:CheY-like chemotaxis protein
MRPTVKILLAEDNKLVLGAVWDTLQLEGWEVVCCQGGEAALAAIESEEYYDLIIMDYLMPGVDGVEFARAARALAHQQATPNHHAYGQFR